MRLEFVRIHYSADTRLSASSSPQPTGEPGYEATLLAGEYGIVTVSLIGISRPREGGNN